MAAHDDATMTIDTNEWTYIDLFGNPHVVNNGETVVWDLSAGENYVVKTDNGIVCTDGYTFNFEKNPTFTKMLVTADATAALYPKAGTWTIVEDTRSGRKRHIWNIVSVTIDNVDQPTSLTITLESRRNKTLRMTLTSITMAQ